LPIEKEGIVEMMLAVGRWIRRSVALAVVALVTGGCGWFGAGGSPTPVSQPTPLPDDLTFEQTLPLYEYDRSRAFDVRESSSWPLGEVQVTDLTYLGVSGLRMPAFLVRPSGDGPFAAAVWMGWSGNWTHIRDEFLLEAADLAPLGAVSLVVSGYFPWHQSPSGAESDRAAAIMQVRELRRAVDFLLAQDGVDAARVAFIGHGTGAMHGLALAAVDDRIRAAALLAPQAALADLVFGGYGLDPATEESYRRAMAPFDPPAMAPHAAPSALFFQFSDADSFISADAARRLYEAASEPKRIGWYGGGHDLDEQARLEREAWLESELGLTTN
jgi:dienelactone hydrolase